MQFLRWLYCSGLSGNLYIGEGDLCIDDVEKRNFNLDREARGQLHVDEVLQLLEVGV